MSKNILQNIIQKKIEKVDKLKKSLDLKTLDELMDKNKFTDWTDYGLDKIIK